MFTITDAAKMIPEKRKHRSNFGMKTQEADVRWRGERARERKRREQGRTGEQDRE